MEWKRPQTEVGIVSLIMLRRCTTNTATLDTAKRAEMRRVVKPIRKRELSWDAARQETSRPGRR